MPDYIVISKNGSWIVKRDRGDNYKIKEGLVLGKELFEVEASCKKKALVKAQKLRFELSQIELAEKGTTVSQTTKTVTEDK
ncbi:MAG: hypothetical protein Q8O75_01115 [bacterium]|nr:hypothetical protein [bacterium]